MSIARKAGVSLAVAMFALGGCTAYSDGTTTGPTTTSVTRSSMGGSSSPHQKTARDPFTLGSCAKFEAMPHECEHSLGR